MFQKLQISSAKLSFSSFHFSSLPYLPVGGALRIYADDGRAFRDVGDDFLGENI
jgi:hypothetical protein